MLTFIPEGEPKSETGVADNVVAIYSAKGGESQSARDGFVKPKHGNGWIKPPFAKGHVPTHSTVPSRYIETMKLARQHSAEAMMTLVERLKDQDGRIAVVAANSILERAWGKAREMKPEERQQAQIDLSSLSAAELQLLVKLVDSGRLRSEPEPTPAGEIEGTATEPDRDR